MVTFSPLVAAPWVPVVAAVLVTAPVLVVGVVLVTAAVLVAGVVLVTAVVLVVAVDELTVLVVAWLAAGVSVGAGAGVSVAAGAVVASAAGCEPLLPLPPQAASTSDVTTNKLSHR